MGSFLNSFYLLVDRPEVYGLPPDPKLPSRNVIPGTVYSMLGAILVGLAGIFSFRNRGATEPAPSLRASEDPRP